MKLPGNPKLGEGKPENQNHAIIFTRGNAVQTIDMNQVKFLTNFIIIDCVRTHAVFSCCAPSYFVSHSVLCDALYIYMLSSWL